MKENVKGFTWWPKDWQSNQTVFDLSLAERGMYFELIQLAYQTNNKIQVNKRSWSRKFNATMDEIDKIYFHLQTVGLIVESNDGLFVHIPSIEKRLRMINGGKKGGKRSAANRLKSNSYNNPSKGMSKGASKGMSNQTETETETESNNTSSKSDDLNVPFDAFWNLYDKKIERAKCERKWSRLKPDERTAVMDHLPKYIRAQPEKQYRKNPSTYLNNQSWNDEIISRDKQPDQITTVGKFKMQDS